MSKGKEKKRYDYSLNGKDYNKKEIVVGDGYKLVKLGDICTFLQKSKRVIKYYSIDKKYCIKLHIYLSILINLLFNENVFYVYTY
jgi:hypothetical protein